MFRDIKWSRKVPESIRQNLNLSSFDWRFICYKYASHKNTSESLSYIGYAVAHWLLSRVKNIANYFAYVSLDPWVKAFLGNPNKKKKSGGGKDTTNWRITTQSLNIYSQVQGSYVKRKEMSSLSWNTLKGPPSSKKAIKCNVTGKNPVPLVHIQT